MICVIADDLTGAAELSGVALRYGLNAQVQLELEASVNADLICISTNTHSCPAPEAAARAARVAGLCRAAEFAVVYKKVDSVLRGWVAVELAVLLRGMDKARALLLPANPSLGRTIRDGRYMVDGRPLHETEFAFDPEHPIRSSEVLSLAGLQSGDLEPAGFPPIQLLPVGSPLPPAGILIGEAALPYDVVAWADMLDASTLPAGAAEFFAALLAKRGFELGCRTPVTARFMTVQRALFVCGSTSDATRVFLHRCETQGLPVLRMPSGLFEGNAQDIGLIAQWTTATVQALDDGLPAILAIGRPLRREPGLPQRLGECMGEVVQRVLEERAVTGIFVEGGATAMALVQALDWKRLVTQRELAPGVVSLRAPGDAGPVLVIKPGSYAWPEEVCRLCSTPGDKVS